MWLYPGTLLPYRTVGGGQKHKNKTRQTALTCLSCLHSEMKYLGGTMQNRSTFPGGLLVDGTENLNFRLLQGFLPHMNPPSFNFPFAFSFFK